MHAEVVEFQVGGGVEDFGKLVYIVLTDLGVEATDLDAVAYVLLEFLLMEAFEFANAVFDDAPAEDFFVNVGELDASGESSEVRVLLDERACVERNGFLETVFADLVEDGTAQFGFDFVCGEAEV